MYFWEAVWNAGDCDDVSVKITEKDGIIREKKTYAHPYAIQIKSKITNACLRSCPIRRGLCANVSLKITENFIVYPFKDWIYSPIIYIGRF